MNEVLSSGWKLFDLALQLRLQIIFKKLCSFRSFLRTGEEIYKVLERMCRAVVLLVTSFVSPCSRSRCRRFV